MTNKNTLGIILLLFVFICNLSPHAIAAPGDNIAPNGTATASSEYDASRTADKAIDGDTNGTFSGGALFSSQSSNQAWWQLDLGAVNNIGDIIVFRRTSGSTGAQNRLETAMLFVSEVPFTSSDPFVLQADPNVTSFSFSNPVPNPSTFTLNTTGRYVRVQLTDTDFLQIAELQVIEGAAGCMEDEIGGIVFRDMNSNGVQTNNESGIANVQAILYDDNGVVDTRITDDAGVYLFSGLTPGQRYRLEFQNLPDNMESSQYALSGSGTSVQFPVAGTCGSDLGLNYPSDYCQTTPELATTCFVDGDPLGGGTSGALDAFVSYSYDATGTDATQINQLALNSDIGSTWGVAYRRSSKEVFVSSMLKRHTGLGPMGLDGIYMIDNSNPAAPTVNQWLDLNTLPSVDVGTDPRTYSLPTTAGTAANDQAVFDNVGKIGIGDIDISDDDRTLYVMNLNNNGELLVIDIESKTLLNRIAVPNPGCGAASDVRPWALNVHHEEVYVGLVCSGQAAGAGDLHYYVLRLSGNALVPFHDSGLGYPKGNVHNEQPGVCNVWETWATSYDDLTRAGSTGAGTRICRPQPILSDIEFDEDMNMIIAFMDRTGNQTGFQQYGTAGTEFYNGYIGGDILKVYNDNGTYVLENAGTTLGGGGCGMNGQGPGGGEFFCNESLTFDNNNDGTPEEIHQETAMGALAYLPGSGEVAATIMDPFTIWEGGISWMNNTTGAESRAFTLYLSAGTGAEAGYFGKSIGLGDIELLCDPAPLEIGNYVWYDEDADGIQDPSEIGLDGVTVNIYLADGTLVGSTVTSDGGQYYFNNDNVNLNGATQLDYYQDYVVAINDPSNFDADGNLSVNGTTYGTVVLPGTGTGQDDLIDSDAVTDGASGVAAVGNSPYIAVMTGYPGEINHSYEFGFLPECPLVNNVSSAAGICSGDVLSELVVQTSEPSSSNMEFVYFTTPQTDGATIYANGTSLGTAPISATTGNATLSNISFPANTGSTTVSYYVYAIVSPAPSNAGCYPYTEMQVDLYPLPTADAGVDQDMCPGGFVQLGATGGVSYVWSPIMGLSSTTVADPTSTVANSMEYSVEVTDANGCTDTDEVIIKVGKDNICLPIEYTRN